MTRRLVVVAISLVLLAAGVVAYLLLRSTDPTDLADGRTEADFPQTSANAFDGVDGGIQLTDNERQGRNTWILWTGGNEQFWDRMSRESFGVVDLLKTIDSRHRPTRFKDMGVVNEPGLKQANQPDQYGLWIDQPDEDYTPQAGLAKSTDPAAIDPKVYGESTGIVGLRLYPNPAFDDSAAKAWDAGKYYTDPNYYLNRNLVRPYRVGMACSFCHIAPYPLNPPADPERPDWKNLASIIGNQYLKEGAVFGYDVNKTPESFFRQLLDTQPPGTSDTSRIATDHNNNPNAMNAIFNVGDRLAEAVHEDIEGGAKNLPAGIQATVPHILKDGADSVGVPGATIRVYVNIGMFHQQWLECHEPLVGLRPPAGSKNFASQKPFDVAKAHKNSVYWRATENRLENVKAFFLRIKPMHLADAPGGSKYLDTDPAVLNRGKVVFAQNCAECHTSKRPPAGLLADSDQSRQWYEKSVQSPDFLDNNFLSDDQRHSVIDIGTNSGRAVGSNAQADHVWDNFSSQTYKDQPSVGAIDCPNPYDPSAPKHHYVIPAGGPGYYRTPSLVSAWSSAPFFHNNALGKYTGDPSVAGRMAAFDDAFDKLLNPGHRENIVWRTKLASYLTIAKPLLPDALQFLATDRDEMGEVLKLGPIPAGTPVNLLANIDPDFTQLGGDRAVGTAKFLQLCVKLKADLLRIKTENMNDTQAAGVMKNLVAPLMELSKCPDFVEDKGHTFGSDLSDADKAALKEFVKRM